MRRGENRARLFESRFTKFKISVNFCFSFSFFFFLETVSVAYFCFSSLFFPALIQPRSQAYWRLIARSARLEAGIFPIRSTGDVKFDSRSTTGNEAGVNRLLNNRNLENPGKNLLEQSREPTIHLTHVWLRVRMVALQASAITTKPSLSSSKR